MQRFWRCFRTTTLTTWCLISVSCSSPGPEATPDCVVPVGSSPVRGSADAKVTIVEFADFECSYCGESEATIAEVDQLRPGLRWAFKHFPLGRHPHAVPAALAADCANQQGKFWEMHDQLFSHQSRLDDAALTSYAGALQLDMAAWDSCRGSAEALQRIEADYNLGVGIGVTGTPAFFIDGIVLPGAYPTSEFLAVIDQADAAANASGLAPAAYYSSIEKQGCSGL